MAETATEELTHDPHTAILAPSATAMAVTPLGYAILTQHRDLLRPRATDCAAPCPRRPRARHLAPRPRHKPIIERT